MDNEDFRKAGHEFIDWMADYLVEIENFPVRSQLQPGDVAKTLSTSPPQKSESIARIFSDFQNNILPGVTHWQNPNFFAYFPCNSSPPSILAEMLTSTMGVNSMLWQTSPAATEMETKVLDWLRQMTGLPESFTGVIQDSASSATLCALLTAREKATDWVGNEYGLNGLGALTAYVSQEAHSSAEKDAMIAGLGRENLRKIPVGPDFSMSPVALEKAIVEDKAAGRLPICVIATLGSTGVGGVDPLREIGEISRRHGLFLHVDAAWAGSALLLPEWRWMIEGIELVDSFVFNPHKWLFTNFDFSAHFLRNPSDLIRTLSIFPEYLKTDEMGQVIDYRDWGIPLGRRFRALKLWFVIRSYGTSELRTKIKNHIEWAREMAGWVDKTDNFEIMSPCNLALFNFRYRPGEMFDGQALNDLNENLLRELNNSGKIYLTQNRIGENFVIRFCVGQTYTEHRHVKAAWNLILETSRFL